MSVNLSELVVANAILAHVKAIRIELAEPITPRRKRASVSERITGRLNKIEGLCGRLQMLNEAKRNAAAEADTLYRRLVDDATHVANSEGPE